MTGGSALGSRAHSGSASAPMFKRRDGLTKLARQRGISPSDPSVWLCITRVAWGRVRVNALVDIGLGVFTTLIAAHVGGAIIGVPGEPESGCVVLWGDDLRREPLVDVKPASALAPPSLTEDHRARMRPRRWRSRRHCRRHPRWCRSPRRSRGPRVLLRLTLALVSGRGAVTLWRSRCRYGAARRWCTQRRRPR